MIRKLKGTQAAAPTGSGTATNLSKATCVRLFNDGTSNRTVTLEQSDGTDIGTFNMAANTTEYLEKDPTDQIFAGSADVKLTSVTLKG